MLFLCAEKVACETQLRLDLLFAVAEIVVCDQGHENAAARPHAYLECGPVIVVLLRIFPRHAVASLALRGFVPMWKPDVPLQQKKQLRGEDDATRVPTPMLNIEGSVVLGKAGFPCIAEDRLNKVNIRDHGSRRHEPNLHAFFRCEARHFGANQWAQEDFDPSILRRVVIHGEWELQVGLFRRQRGVQQLAENRQRHRLLVVGDRVPTLGDVKDAGSGALVVHGIVENTVMATEGLDERARVGVAVAWERKFPGHAVAVQTQHLGKFNKLPSSHFSEVFREECLDAHIDWRDEICCTHLQFFFHNNLQPLLSLLALHASRFRQATAGWPRSGERHRCALIPMFQG
mmetsp:Transcript_116776/g.371626  ORF Transcript_116776/g.371626 Transcript_116776/m.371626 type:complete len:345 (+) Transcript_116776:1570-2604(+)